MIPRSQALGTRPRRWPCHVRGERGKIQGSSPPTTNANTTGIPVLQLHTKLYTTLDIRGIAGCDNHIWLCTCWCFNKRLSPVIGSTLHIALHNHQSPLVVSTTLYTRLLPVCIYLEDMMQQGPASYSTNGNQADRAVSFPGAT